MARQQPRPFGWVLTGCMRARSVYSAIYRHAARSCGRPAVFLVITFLGLVTSLYFAVLWPKLHWRTQLLQGVPAALLLAGVLSNYVMCVVTLPGNTDHLPEGYHLAAPAEVQYCATCRKARPPFAHHCSICNKCVLQHTNHCCFINNCVGLRNQAHWMRFILYALMGSSYAAVISLQYLQQAAGPIAWAAQPFRAAFVCTYVLCTGIATGTAALVAWHAWRLASGQVSSSPVQACEGPTRKAGGPRAWGFTFAHNFKEVMRVSGRFWWLLWLLPAVNQPPLEDDIDCPPSSRIPRLRITSLPF